MRATLDGEVFDPISDECLGIFEAKHCGTRNTDAELFERYVPQLTHNCMCAGRTTAFLSIFKGNGDWCMFEYELDDAYAAALIAAEDAFWQCVQTGEPPVPLPPPPAPKPKGIVDYDMAASNAWASHAADYIETELAADRHTLAKQALKELVPADASKAFGHGITIKRSKSGSLLFSKG
jgi:predicted phage-related endonuclease